MKSYIDNSTKYTGSDKYNDILQRLSIAASDALRLCGVYHLTTFMLLTAEELLRSGANPLLADEIFALQQQIIVQNDASTDNNTVQSHELLAKIACEPTKLSFDMLIPEEMMLSLPKKVLRSLRKNHITTCKQLLALKEQDFDKLPSTKIKTEYLIRLFQDKITTLFPYFSWRFRYFTHYDKRSILKNQLILQRLLHPSSDDQNDLSVPADWSILSYTLPEIFDSTDLISQNKNFDSQQFLVSDVILQTHHLKQLRTLAIFPDDSADTLLSISLAYLLQIALDDELLFVVLDYIAQLAGHPNSTYLKIAPKIIADKAIFFDIPVGYVSSRTVKCSPLTRPFGMQNNYHNVTWGEVAQSTEKEILATHGFTTNALTEIQYIWQLKKVAQDIISNLSQVMDINEFTSYDSFIKDIIKPFVKDDRGQRILINRLGFLDGDEWTLERLGIREGLTRERIRQLIHKKITLLNSATTVDKLSQLWELISESLSANNGVCLVAEIAAAVATKWHWDAPPPAEALATVIKLSPDFRIIPSSPIRVTTSWNQCINCPRINNMLQKEAAKNNNAGLPCNKALEMLLNFCQTKCKFNHVSVQPLSRNFLDHFIGIEEKLMIENDVIYVKHTFMTYHKSRLNHLEEIVLKSGTTMHFSEIASEFRLQRPDESLTPDNYIHAQLLRISNLLSWGRGVFIHRDLISFPYTILNAIESFIIQQLHSDVQYISINGVFHKFHQLLASQNIPNEQALYSCLRSMKNTIIEFRIYPYIALKGKSKKREPIQLELEEFVKQTNGITNLKTIHEHFIKKMHLSKQVLSYNLCNSTKVLRVNYRAYIHLDFINISKADIEIIASDVKRLLLQQNTVSSNDIYAKHREICQKLNITTPTMLRSLLRLYFSDCFTSSHNSSILRLNDRKKQADEDISK